MVNVAIYASSQSADAESAELNDDEEKFAVKYSTYIVGFTAALLNLIVILILNSVSRPTAFQCIIIRNRFIQCFVMWITGML